MPARIIARTTGIVWPLSRKPAGTCPTGTCPADASVEHALSGLVRGPSPAGWKHPGLKVSDETRQTRGGSCMPGGNEIFDTLSRETTDRYPYATSTEPTAPGSRRFMVREAVSRPPQQIASANICMAQLLRRAVPIRPITWLRHWSARAMRRDVNDLVPGACPSHRHAASRQR